MGKLSGEDPTTEAAQESRAVALRFSQGERLEGGQNWELLKPRQRDWLPETEEVGAVHSNGAYENEGNLDDKELRWRW